MTKEGKFAPILETKIDLKKINLDIISKWVQAKITEILGFEDEIIINLVINMLTGEVIIVISNWLAFLTKYLYR